MAQSIETLSQFSLFFLLVSVPLFRHFTPYGYENPKVIVFMTLSGFLFFLTLFHKFLKNRQFKLDLIQKLALIRFLYLCFSSFLGQDFLKSFSGNYYRFDGLVTELFLLLFLFSLKNLDPKHKDRLVLIGLSAGNLLSSLWTLLSPKVFPQGAGFVQPVFLAGYLLTTTPAVWTLIENYTQKHFQKILFSLCTILIYLALFFTHTDLPMIAFPLLLISWLSYSRFQIKHLLFVFFLGLLFTIFTAAFNPYLNQSVFESRSRIFHKAYFAFLTHPLTGWGLANFDLAFSSTVWPITYDHDVYVDKAHSTLIESLVTGGIIGFSIQVVFYLFVIYRVVSKSNRHQKFLLLTLLIYLWHSQTNVISISEELIFWLIAGFL